MQTYQKDFIELALQYQALRFGEFTLKSGRLSPYFFNAGVFNTGEALKILGQCYANAITQAKVAYDVLFGPAYKGIPLACTTAMALANSDNPIPYAYNRKEAKDHGEGGLLVGAPLLNQRALIIDDVITAGTAIRESIELISHAKGTLAGVVVALDRQEKGTGNTSAIQEIEANHNVPVVAIIRLADIMDYVSETPSFKVYLEPLQNYRKKYGI